MSYIRNFFCELYIFVSRLWEGVKRRVSQYAMIYSLQKAHVVFHKNSITFYGMAVFDIQKGAHVSIGENFICSSGIRYPIDNKTCSKITVKAGASLKIGDNVGMSNTCIQCHQSIEIGQGVKLGAGVMIFDTDFHSLDWRDRADHTDIEKRIMKPVLIENFVFIGANSIILKGVSIGEKSIIGAGSVVSHDVPAEEIWAGNPARFIKKIK